MICLGLYHIWFNFPTGYPASSHRIPTYYMFTMKYAIWSIITLPTTLLHMVLAFESWHLWNSRFLVTYTHYVCCCGYRAFTPAKGDLNYCVKHESDYTYEYNASACNGNKHVNMDFVEVALMAIKELELNSHHFLIPRLHYPSLCLCNIRHD